MPAPYSRSTLAPLKRFNFEVAQAQVAAIRATGHAQPTGHARIFINDQNRDALRERIARNHMLILRDAIALADRYFGLAATNNGGHLKEPEAQPVVLACAILYQLLPIPGVVTKYTPVQYGLEGCRHLLSLLDGTYTHIEYLGLPLGYDWLFGLLDPDVRQLVATRLLDNADPTPRIRRWNNLPGAGLLGSLAVLGDGIDDARAQRQIDSFYSGVVFGEPSNAAPGYQKDTVGNLTGDMIFTPHGPGAEGMPYADRQAAFLPLLEAWSDQFGKDYFELPCFQNWIYHYTHSRGNQGDHLGKYMVEKKSARNTLEVAAWYAMGLQRSTWGALVLAQWYYEQGIKPRDSVRFIYMLRAGKIPALTPEQIGLHETAHFLGTNNVFSRTNWKDPDATWFSFQSPTWLSVRDLGTANELLIKKYGGMLLCKREQQHDYDGGNRTNTIVLYDEQQPGKTIIPANVMDRAINRRLGIDVTKGGKLADLTEATLGYNDGLRFFEEKPGEWLYVFGDGARAFPQGLLSGWSRQVLCIWGGDGGEDVFVVLDRVSKTSDKIREHVLWQSVQEPEVRDRASNVEVESISESPGISLHNANRIVIENRTDAGWGPAHGRLTIDTLIPANPVYYKMGGGKLRNVDLWGVNAPADTQRIVDLPYAGEWRVQVTSGTRSSECVYLHVLQTGDANQMENQVKTAVLDSDQFAVQAGKTIAVLSATEAEIQSGFCVVVDADTYSLWIGNLTPNAEYVLDFGGLSRRMVASDTGLISIPTVNLTAGQRVNVSRYVAPPSTTANVRYTFKTPEVKEAFLNFMRLEQANPGTSWEELPEGGAQ
jgi:hypothetical protein